MRPTGRSQNQIVADIRKLRRKDSALFGNKSANLGELASIGLAVPKGFAISVQAFIEFLTPIVDDMSPTFLSPDASLDIIISFSPKLRMRILRASYPEPIAEIIRGQYRKLCNTLRSRLAPVAVRSSALAEDSPDASFAGIFETFLWVRGQRSLLQSIKRCYASLFASGGLAYRKEMGLTDTSKMLMGVVVLQMINARSGGTLFSGPFVRDQPDTLSINANWGLPTTVVDGNYPVDTFEISKADQSVVKENIAHKTKMSQYMYSTKQGTIRDVPESIRDKSCLNQRDLALLSRGAILAEKHFGHPVDIEWCIEKTSNRVYFLQCRPLVVIKS